MQSTSHTLDIYPLEATKKFVENVMLGSHAAKSYIMVERENEMPIGVLSLINIDFKNRNTECIIDIGEKEYWGKGYGKEGLKLLLDFAFYEMNLHRVSLIVFSFNVWAYSLYNYILFH